MKRFLILVLPIFLICCHFKISEKGIDYTGYFENTVMLTGLDSNYKMKDSLAELTIMIPERLDTFYKWHMTSDCVPCGEIKYRFSNKDYPQFAERGFFWTFVPDSVYQLTITHSPVKEVPDSVVKSSYNIKDTARINYLADNLTLGDKTEIVKKEFRVINNRSFIISCLKTPAGYLTNDTTLYLVASTRIKSRNVNIIAECGAKDTTGFIDLMYKSILSVRIVEK